MCYDNPLVRKRHRNRVPARGNRGLADAEVLALPVFPFGDDNPEPPPYLPPAEERKLGDLMAQWAAVGRFGEFDLHPDTEPAVIRAGQRADVAEARGRLRLAFGREPTAAEIGEDAILATWSVERLLAELDGVPA